MTNDFDIGAALAAPEISVDDLFTAFRTATDQVGTLTYDQQHMIARFVGETLVALGCFAAEDMDDVMAAWTGVQ